MALPDPRSIEDRIEWFLSNVPDLDGDGKADIGACARHTWLSLGGDRGNPPRWGAANANEVYRKIVASGRYSTSANPPRGAVVAFPYGKYGHLALSAGGMRIVTTDPQGKPGGTGIEELWYPRKWGASKFIWTDQYNGVQFPVRREVRLASVVKAAFIDPKAKPGTFTARSHVKRLEKALADEGLLNPLYVDGHYGTATVAAYKKWQEKLGYEGPAADGIPGWASLKALGKSHGFTAVKQ